MNQPDNPVGALGGPWMFGQALTFVMAGGRARRSIWDDGRFLALDEVTGWPALFDAGGDMVRYYEAHPSDQIAADWEAKSA